MKKFFKSRLNTDFVVVIMFNLALIILYFFGNVISVKIDQTIIGGTKRECFLSLFNLITGTNDFEKEYIFTVASVFILILPIVSIVLNFFIRKFKNVTNIITGLIFIGLFFACFLKVYFEYRNGVDVGLKNIPMNVSISVFGYIYLLIVLLFIANSVYTLVKNRNK